ncbi:alkaline ceramidase family protein [Penicillium atrosanguineum]|uniref:Alkaline ceramidase family protein n=1 Tax=Penicillium atrosanguineum TaxID=1132637 RepID=A0A9W9Q089_9EURO|nr:alkaline ceramidase family protein [Penicillium atrosanguineum]KAJ5321409.1 alkaline ceramidase family protein [Penicillium atrosanguineum]
MGIRPVVHNYSGGFWVSAKKYYIKTIKDYGVTRYIAEFINTLTNLVYVIYAIYGIRKLYMQQNPKANAFRTIPYWGLMTVGICSAAFHMSLKYHTQMMDDLSMLFTTTPVLHRVLTVNSSLKTSIIMAVVLGTSLMALVVYHVIADELIVHSLSFVLSIAVIGIRTIQLINVRTVEGSAARREIWGVVRFGAVIFHMGYAVWIFDGWACLSLRSTRHSIGLPWAFFLELHGWWHIFTGIGAYIFIAVIDHLASGEDGPHVDMYLAWPAPWASRSIFAGRLNTLPANVDKKRE